MAEARSDPAAGASAPSVVARNIQRLQERRRAEQEEATWSDRLADRVTGFAGSMRFVGLHLLIYGGWIAVNVAPVAILPRFDPTLVLLAMAASVEAIFLSTFVLISQNRMSRRADERADLDLQINLLAEHELTRLIGLVEAIARHHGVAAQDDMKLDELKREIAPEHVLDEIAQAHAEDQ